MTTEPKTLKSYLTVNNLKLATSMVVGTSVKTTVAAVIASNVAPESKADKAKILIGSYLITTMVADQAKAHVINKIDKQVERFHEVKKQLDEAIDQKENEPEA